MGTSLVRSKPENEMKKPSAKVQAASTKVPKIKAQMNMKAANSAKVTVTNRSAKVNGQKITKL